MWCMLSSSRLPRVSKAFVRVEERLTGSGPMTLVVIRPLMVNLGCRPTACAIQENAAARLNC